MTLANGLFDAQSRIMMSIYTFFGAVMSRVANYKKTKGGDHESIFEPGCDGAIDIGNR
jgi:hypothetical protein